MITKLEMKSYSMIFIVKQQKTQISHQVELIKYENLTGNEILTPDQSRMIEEAKFTYSPLRKAFDKQVRKINGKII